MTSPFQLADNYLHQLIYEERQHFFMNMIRGNETENLFYSLIKDHPIYRLLIIQAIMNTSPTTYKKELDKLMKDEYNEMMGISEEEMEE